MTGTLAARSRKRARPLKSAHMQIRVTPDLKSLAAEAAALLGTSVSDFATRAIRRAAQDEILDRRVFALKSADFERFVAILDDPPALPKAAKARLRRKPVWEKA